MEDESEGKDGTKKCPDRHLDDARRLKHQADSLSDPLLKSLMYIEAVLSFLMCGDGMEHDKTVHETKVFTMYRDTFSLIKHICKYRGGGQSPEPKDHDKKKLAVLSLRIQSLLCLKLFKLKKAEVAKFKKIIDEYNKTASTTTSKPGAQAPSPYQSSWNNRSTGTPSPMSPQPSPAGSVCSVGSAGSGNGDYRMTNGNLSSGSGATISPAAPVGSSMTSLPSRIHSITNQYMSYLAYLQQCHDLWDMADTQALECTDFFEDLDRQRGGLTLHSSMTDLVSYIRLGIHHLKDT